MGVRVGGTLVLTRPSLAVRKLLGPPSPRFLSCVTQKLLLSGRRGDHTWRRRESVGTQLSLRGNVSPTGKEGDTALHVP